MSMMPLAGARAAPAPSGRAEVLLAVQFSWLGCARAPVGIVGDEKIDYPSEDAMLGTCKRLGSTKMLTPESQVDRTNEDDPIDVAVAAINAVCGRQIEARIVAGSDPISREIASQMLLLLGLAHLADEQQGVPELQWKDLVMHAALNAIVGRSGPVAAGLDSYWHARTVRERDRRKALEDENRHLRARICALESTCDTDQAA